MGNNNGAQPVHALTKPFTHGKYSESMCRAVLARSWQARGGVKVARLGYPEPTPAPAPHPRLRTTLFPRSHRAFDPCSTTVSQSWWLDSRNLHSRFCVSGHTEGERQGPQRPWKGRLGTHRGAVAVDPLLGNGALRAGVAGVGGAGLLERNSSKKGLCVKGGERSGQHHYDAYSPKIFFSSPGSAFMPIALPDLPPAKPP